MPVVPGDPFGKEKEARTTRDLALEPREVALLHLRSDVDAARYSQHHTLGHKHNQSSPGDHIHDGASSKKVGDGVNITITGSRGGNDALTSLINELKKVIEIDDNTTA